MKFTRKAMKLVDQRSREIEAVEMDKTLTEEEKSARIAAKRKEYEAKLNSEDPEEETGPDMAWQKELQMMERKIEESLRHCRTPEERLAELERQLREQGKNYVVVGNVLCHKDEVDFGQAFSDFLEEKWKKSEGERTNTLTPPKTENPKKDASHS